MNVDGTSIVLAREDLQVDVARAAAIAVEPALESGATVLLGVDAQL